MASTPVALITGSTDGLGRAVAQHLARSGLYVIVHGRDGARGDALCRQITDAGGQASFLGGDLASLTAVRALAQEVLSRHARLDLLINNAGIGTGAPRAPREVSADGHELRFAVNYLAGFLLTRLLLPRLRASAPARIVNVASAAQYPLDFDNLMLERAYSGMRAYAQSKLAQVMMTFDLAQTEANSGVTANCLHPASLMDTNLVRQTGIAPKATVETGAAAVLRLAAGTELAGANGLFLDGHQEARAHAQAYDRKARECLSEVSLRLTGLSS